MLKGDPGKPARRPYRMAPVAGEGRLVPGLRRGLDCANLCLMPIYEFHCEKCEKDSEILVRSSRWQGTKCPACGSSRLIKKLSVFSASAAAEAQRPACAGNGAGACGCCCGGGKHKH